MRTVSVLFGAAILLAMACRTDLHIVSYAVPTDALTTPIRIVFLSDLHSCTYGEGQERLLKQIRNQDPDLLLLGGDIVDDKLPQEPAWELLSAVSDAYPCFYVSGNHEIWSNHLSEIKAGMRQLGIAVLEGDCIWAMVNGQQIAVCGADDPEMGESVFEEQLQQCAAAVSGGFPDASAPDNVLPPADETAEPAAGAADGSDGSLRVFSILLSHRPERISQYAAYGFDLVLAGHAHGGQWRIPLLMNGLIAPNQGLFPQYAGGLYEEGATRMIVSRGLAKESTRVPRICNRPEIVVVELLPTVTAEAAVSK